MMKAHMILRFLLVLGLILSCAPLAALAQDSEKYVSIRLLPEKTDVKGGETITVGLHHKIHEGWHTYWLNAGDSGTPARVTWTGVDDIESAPIQWPIPKKLPMGPLMNFGYEGEVILLQDITFPEDLDEGPHDITAKIEILVCHEICIPETHTAGFTINGDEEPVPAAVEMARTKLPLDMGWQAQMGEQDGDLVVRIATDTPNAFADLSSIELYPEEWGLITYTEKTSAAKDDSHLVLTHTRGDRALSDVPVSKLVIAYDDANGDRKAVRVSALIEPTLNETAAPPSPENNLGIIKAILLAFLGGLILNLMPCVFPVLSMKALSLVKLKDEDNKKARLYGIAYTLGILACFALIAGLLLALKATGSQVGWGFQLQHPAVILFLAYLFFTLALNLAGYFDINLGLANVGSRLAGRTGMTGSFFTGVLATLVATPCTAPFMGAAMGYALTQSAFVSMVVFLFLGLGLAAPYLALCLIPALRHVLPKPGAWMETFRQFLSFPMFASALWLLWVLSQQVSHMSQFAALLGMLFIGLGIWIYKNRSAHRICKPIAVVLSLLAFLFVATTFSMMKPMEAADAETLTLEKGDNWEAFTRARLADHLEGDDPVFVNMTAAWCITCKVNEKVALNIDSTRALFAQKNIKYLKGDWTNQNPEITNFLEEYGRSGVPIYVYYGPRETKGGTRPEPVVLPQLLTPGLIAETLTSTKGAYYP